MKTPKKLKLSLKNTITHKMLQKAMDIFDRKVYRRILGPVYDNEKENWRILNNKEIYALAKQPTTDNKAT
jgi:hypothetical protein